MTRPTLSPAAARVVALFGDRPSRSGQTDDGATVLEWYREGRELHVGVDEDGTLDVLLVSASGVPVLEGPATLDDIQDLRSWIRWGALAWGLRR